MKNKEVFQTSNTPSTKGVDSGYRSDGTGLALDLIANYVQKTELSIVKEGIVEKIDNLKKDISEIKESLTGRENRFWIINAIIIGAIVAIFLFALPYVYYSPIEKQNTALQNTYKEIIDNVNTLIQELQAKSTD
jgi:hypothetical protein